MPGWVGFWLMWPGLVAAQSGWMPLDGAGISEALTDRTLIYAAAEQHFFASGRTSYTRGGHDEWGYWRIEGDRYCSQWPPSDLWACYDVAVQGVEIRFTGPNGDVSEGTYGAN